METIYLLCSIITIGIFLISTIIRTRRAILGGAVFISLMRDSLPWGYIPHTDIAYYAQVIYFMVLFIYFLLLKNKREIAEIMLNKYNQLLLIFSVIMFLFTLFSSDTGYGLSKSTIFLLKSVLPIIAITVLRPSKRDSRLIVSVITLGSCLMTLKLFSFGQVGATNINGHVSDPIMIGRNIGLGLTLTVLNLFSTSRYYKRIVFLLLSAFLLCGLVVNGERGPLLAIVFSYLMLILFIHNSGLQRVKVLFRTLVMLSLLSLGYLLVPVTLNNVGGFQRLSSEITTIGRNKSDLGRIERYQVAMEGFTSTFGVGLGTGGFASEYGMDDTRQYPHNLFLEVGAEQGVTGLFILLALLITVLNRIRKYTKFIEGSCKILVCCWFYALFNSLVSADVAANSELWITGGMCWWLTQHKLSKSTEIPELKNEPKEDKNGHERQPAYVC